MKRIKILISLLIVPMLSCVVISLLPSCNNEEEENDTFNSSTYFLCDFLNEIQLMSKSNIGFHSSLQRSRRSPGNIINDTIIIGANFPEGTSQNYYEQAYNASSFNDLAQLAHETAAEFTENVNDGTDCEVSLSKWAYDIALSDAIQESKEYLYNKGLTDEDIEEMLAENNADESSLVVFVLVLSAIETQQLAEDNETCSSSFESLQPIMKIYANNGIVSKEYAAKVLKCAMEATGIDIISQLQNSAIKTWSKAAIKKAFGTVIKRATGPAGVAIAIISFITCMN